jgi:hypothetical protein
MESSMLKGRGDGQQIDEAAQQDRIQLWTRWVKANPKKAAKWVRDTDLNWRTADIPDM